MFVSTSQDPTPPENNDISSSEEAQIPAAEQEQPSTEEPTPQISPEAQDETNGGPLGCCLGVMVGLLLSLSVAIISRFYADQLAQALGGTLSIITRIAMALVGLIAVIICGKFGWKIGKKLYRVYDPPEGLS
jgi:uncharacterized membrane protein YuzA (DUF378 family)